MRRRSLIFIIVTLLALVIAVFISGSLSAPDGGSETGPFAENEQVSLSGQLVCLPHRDQSGPQTMECAYGFRDESGTYYALEDASEDYSLISSAPMNQPVQIEGTYRSNPDTKYLQSGLIRLTAVNK